MMIILLAFASSVLGAASVLPTGCICFRCTCFRLWLWLCWWIRSSAPFYSDAVAYVNFSLSLSLLTRLLSFGCVASRYVIGVDGTGVD